MAIFGTVLFGGYVVLQVAVLALALGVPVHGALRH